MCCCIVASIDAISMVNINTCLHVVVIFPSAHDSIKHREVGTIPIDVAMGLLISVCRCRACLPDVRRDETMGEVECRQCKLRSFDFVF